MRVTHLKPLIAALALCGAVLIACNNPAAPPKPAPTPPPAAPPIPAGHAGIYFPKVRGFAGSREDMQAFTWMINQDTLRLRNDTLFFKPRPGLDTLTFIRPRQQHPEKLYCDFRPDSLYQITPNECCGDFELSADHFVFARDTAVFVAEGLPPGSRWIGVAGSSAVWLKNGESIPFRGDNLGGPMMPKRYRVAIQTFTPAQDSACFVLDPHTRKELACFDSSTEPLFSMVYVSLHGDCPWLWFDGKRRRVRVGLE